MSAAWKPVSPSSELDIDWLKLLGTERPIDPFLVWADQTRFAGFGIDPATERLPLAVEVDRPNLPVPIGRTDCQVDGASCSPEFGLLDIPGAYKAVVDADRGHAELVSRFITASIRACDVGELLRHQHHIKRFQLGVPRIPAVATGAASLSSGAGRGRDRVVVGVIDDGFGFAHPQFLNSVGQPRTCFLWDQDRSRKTAESPSGAGQYPWRALSDFGYGGELYWSDLKLAVTAAADNEVGAYVRASYLPHAPEPDRHATSPVPCDGRPVPAGTLLKTTHGTSVLHLCAANLAPVALASADQGLLPPELAKADFARAWPLVLVQLPTRTTLDTSGGSLAVHILDGIRYILRRAEAIEPERSPRRADYEMPDPVDLRFDEVTPPVPSEDGGSYFPDNRVVINISYGAVGGPHDGTSIVEQAIYELAGGNNPARPGTWVVLAAGNSHQSRTHARLEIRDGGPPKSLQWHVGPDNLLESYLEIWLPDGPRDAAGDPSAPDSALERQEARALLDRFQVTLKPPGGLPLQKLSLGEANVLIDARQPGPIAAGIFAKRVVQGTRGTMLLLAVARTLRPTPATTEADCVPVAPHGMWTVEISLAAASKRIMGPTYVVHAWAERNDRLWGNIRPQQSTVTGDDPVPEPTEYFPSVLDACRRESAAFDDSVPRPFLPDSSLSSIASMPPPTHKVDDANAFLKVQTPYDRQRPGGVVVVGSYRLWDGEVPTYSASGPARGTQADGGRRAGGGCRTLGFMPGTDERMGPDYSAPSDQGSAARGLPTRGLISSAKARLSGTSAAAPLVTRHLANTAYQAMLDALKLPHEARTPYELDEAKDGKRGELQATLSLSDEDRAIINSRRSTPTPTRDERFRLGRNRLTVRSKAP